MTAAATEGDLRARKREWKRDFVRQQAYGQWNPWVDADPVREHIRALRAAGIGRDRIARLAGVSRSTLAGIIYGRPAIGAPPSPKIRPATAAKLLAVRATRDLYPEEARVDAVGTRRRLQALGAAGWPGVTLGRLGGWEGTYVCELQHRTGVVYVRTARRAAALYAELAAVDPASRGVAPAVARRTRLRAERLGWLPPGVWDGDIDDPKADPLAPDPDKAKASVNDPTRPERIAAARVLHAEQGLSLVATAERLGLSDRTVQRWKNDGWQVSA